MLLYMEPGSSFYTQVKGESTTTNGLKLRSYICNSDNGTRTRVIPSWPLAVSPASLIGQHGANPPQLLPHWPVNQNTDLSNRDNHLIKQSYINMALLCGSIPPAITMTGRILQANHVTKQAKCFILFNINETIRLQARHTAFSSLLSSVTESTVWSQPKRKRTMQWDKTRSLILHDLHPCSF